MPKKQLGRPSISLTLGHLGPVSPTADEAELPGHDHGPTISGQWLLELLADGPRPAGIEFTTTAALPERGISAFYRAWQTAGESDRS
jgi:hypothetical protein